MSHGAQSLSPPPPATPPKPDLLRGWIKTTEDAVLVFEATRVGIVPRVTRRFHELEKRSIIKSGAILVFTEEESGIKRWTDPYIWSASRTQGDFLMYRERENEHVPDPGSPYRCSVLSSPADESETLDPELEYYILGSWNKGKGLKKNGLMKKTISMTMEGTTYHLISYYYPSDVRSGVLRTPSSMPHLASLRVNPALVQGISHSRQSPLHGKKKGRSPRS
ncbi:Gti1/Pac2 family-domain-containing protein [Daedaleopsis nitida]|nr:Gti1/Pac2 family-domain-containing protein [Daedaleopsis nitida]